MDILNTSEDPDQYEEEWDPTEDIMQVDQKGNILRIEHPDGAVTISLDGKSLINDPEKSFDEKWFSNLALNMEDRDLSDISEMLLRRIEQDISAREQKISVEPSYIMNLMGFVKKGNSQGGSGSMDGLANFDIRHPLLLQAVVSFQSNIRNELLPTDGPLKVHDYSDMSRPVNKTGMADTNDQLADKFETLMNFYLRKGAPEYYPEMDRMLFTAPAVGDGFQKTFNCPRRQRPVIETINYDDLVVSIDATHLSNAARITQIIRISENDILRMQLYGTYRDVDLGRAVQPDASAYDMSKEAQQGTMGAWDDPDNDDVDREVYEIRCKLNIPGYEHKHKGKTSRIKVPYTVLIDKSSREILSITRNYDKDDLKQDPIECYVQFPFIPADYGFYSIGLANLLQNPTRALSRAWTILLDNGFLGNFPGMIYDNQAFRGDSAILNVPAGGAAAANVPMGKTIQDILMPLPYKDVSPTFSAFVDNVAGSFGSITSATEKLVEEGKQNAPVGTTVALIEEAQKILSAVHKRYLDAQGHTFEILMDCFRRDPEAFLRFDKSATRDWDMELFTQALNRFTLVPKADPNTASHIQRMTKMVLLNTLMNENPDKFDKDAVLLDIMRAAKFSSPERYLLPPAPPNEEIPPEVLMQQQLVAAKMKEAEAKVVTAEAKVQENKISLVDSQADAENRAAERESREEVEILRFMREEATHPETPQYVRDEADPIITALITNSHLGE